jgi:chemotaxis protein CheD
MTKTADDIINSYIQPEKDIIKLGEVVFTKNPEKYNLLGLGTCIGVFLYDLKQETYMMAHTVLPKYSSHRTEISSDNLGRFTDLAIRLMVKKMVKEGSNKKDIRCKLVGGGRIYNDALDVGLNNIECARSILQEEEIRIVAEDLGGNDSRSILSFSKDGTLQIRKKGVYFDL